MVEADLQRFYQVRLGDLWLGGLSLRRLSVLVAHLPPESATARHFSSIPEGWDTHAFLIADLYHGLTGNPHPARPQPKAEDKRSKYAELRLKLDAQKRRIREREERAKTPTT